MSLYKRGDVFWCLFYVGGKRHRVSTGKLSRREAATEERRLRAEAEAAPSSLGVPADRQLVTLVARDIERAEIKNTSEIHRQVLEQRWGRILSVLGPQTDIGQVTAAVASAYARTRKSEGLRGQTINRELADLKRVILAAGLPLPTPWPKLPKDVPSKAHAGKLHDPSVVLAVLEAVPEDVRDGAHMCYATGLRFGELRRVDVRWLERPKFAADVPWLLRLPPEATKGRKSRVVGITQEIHDMMMRRPQPHPFPRANYRKALHTACKRLGVETLTLRDLRHMFGSAALKQTGNIQAVSHALGHSALTTTMLYLHAEERDIADVAARIPTIAATREQPQAPLATVPTVQLPDLIEKKVELIGIEPTTSGLQTSKLSEDEALLRRIWADYVQQNPGTSKPSSHTLQPQTLNSHSDWTRALCSTCGVVEVLPPMGLCPGCDGELLEVI